MFWKSISPSRLPDIDAQNICVVKPSALGDVVQTLPVLPALKARFPTARISWVISGSLAGLLEDHPCLDELLRYHRQSGVRDGIALLSELRRRRFDLVFDLQGLLRTGVMTAATGAAVRVGLQTAREGARFACNLTLPDTGRQVPAHQRYWRVAEAIGAAESSRQTILPIGNDDQSWAGQQCHPLARPLLAVHPGARWVTKRWPVEKFAAVAAKAVRQFGAGIVVLGTGQERETAELFERMLVDLCPYAAVRNLAGQTTLKQLAAVLAHADAFLGNDSGPMHLAAGLGTPVTALFTCTSPILSGPPGPSHETVTTQLSCAASYKKRCPYRGRKHMACLDEVGTERVWQSLIRLIEKNKLADRAA